MKKNKERRDLPKGIEVDLPGQGLIGVCKRAGYYNALMNRGDPKAAKLALSCSESPAAVRGAIVAGNVFKVARNLGACLYSMALDGATKLVTERSQQESFFVAEQDIDTVVSDELRLEHSSEKEEKTSMISRFFKTVGLFRNEEVDNNDHNPFAACDTNSDSESDLDNWVPV